jgi:outer membrane protein assembly factor BamB
VTGDLAFVTDGEGVLRCFDALTGELYWEHDLGADVTCRAQVVADGKLYVGTDRRTFFILRADREKEVLFEGKLDGQSATPGLDDGMLILATERSITAYRPALKARAGK